MSSDTNHKKAADKIAAIIEKGFLLTRQELHFIESSFSVSSADDLKQLILNGDSDCDVICELAVSPDDMIRETLELFFCSASLGKEDEKIILASLSEKNLESKIIFPETGNSVSIPLSTYLIERFITKLRITRTPDMRLVAATEVLPGHLRLKTLVRLRHSSISNEKPTIDFLIELISQKTINEEMFYDVFDFAVSSLEDDSQSTGIMEIFISKKRFYEKTLSTIKEVKKQLETSAVETLMMQGTRIPPVSENEVKANIEKAETILAIVFGYTDIPGNKPSEVNLGNIPDKKDIKKVFRLLS